MVWLIFQYFILALESIGKTGEWLQNFILKISAFFLTKPTYTHARTAPPPPSSLNTTSYTLSSTLHLEGQTRYFTVLDRHTIELDKNKMDSKFIKSHQWYLQRSHPVLTEFNPEFWSRPSPISTKIYFHRSTSHKNLHKQNIEDFFIQLLYAWLHLTNNNIPLPYL